MGRVGEALRSAGVASIHLVHGTFVGEDGLGWWRELGRVWPAAAAAFSRGQKRLVDFVVGDVGNYPPRFVREMADGLTSSGETGPSVQTWNWDSQNNHVGRAEAALRLIVHLATTAPRDGRRVLLWGHSHAGNVFAIVSNLLVCDDMDRHLFLDAVRQNYLSLFGDLPADSVWRAAHEILSREGEALRAMPLDMVTFGTPIRYGWLRPVDAKLLHIVHHRPENVRPASGRLPFRLRDAWRAWEGDYVQRLGIAGSNWPPLVRWRAGRADRALHRLLQSGVSSAGWFERMRLPLRVSDEGPTLAIDYGPQRGGPLRHLLGHGVYTRRRWMLFHAELVCARFYGLPPLAP